MWAHVGTQWHILAHVGIRISPHFIPWDNSFRSSIKFFHLKIALWLGLGKSWPLLAQPQKKTRVHKGMLLWESFPKQTCRNYLRRKQGSKLMGQTQTVQHFFCASLGRSLCHGSQHHGNMSGHHDCSTKAVFLCTADKLQCWPILARNDTYWRILAFSFLHISFIGTIALVVLSSSFI